MTNEITPAPGAEEGPKLATLGDVGRELACIYRDAKKGRRTVEEASKLANILAVLTRALEAHQADRVSERLDALEAKTNL